MKDPLIQYSQLGAIFDYLSLGVIVLSRDRRIEALNRCAEVLTGRREADVKGCYCYTVFMEYLCGGQCKYLESRGAERETVVSGIEMTDLDNKRARITKIESPLYDAGGRLVGCIEVFQDHSAFQELIQRIRFEDARLQLILDNLDIGVLTVDRGNHISFFNTIAEELTGFSRTELLGKPCARIFGEAFCRDFRKDASKIITRKTGGEDRVSHETEVVTRQGQPIPVRAKHMPLKNEKGLVVGGLTTITDLSLKHQLNNVIRDRYTYYDMVGRHPDMRKLFEIIPVVAASDATVLIEGPTGTGKDLLAKIIHNLSKRSGKKMVKVNCASLPDNLLESEMFGYVKGAFTGADRDKPGRFQLADGGTIFLDEIGDLPLSLQAKLLRVLEDREYYALGSRRTTRVDVRIISATNQNLKKLVREKRFREDLFYRLNVMRLELPSLKRRKSDLPLLIPHILKRLSTVQGAQAVKIDENAMAVLLNYDYPGNVRELENILEHALIICQGDMIERKHLPIWLTETADCTEDEDEPFGDAPDETAVEEEPAPEEMSEKAMIIETLEKYRWNKGRAAQALNIDRSTLWRKMKRFHIQAR